MDMLTVRFTNGRQVQCPFHTEVKDLMADFPPDASGLPYIGALVNNDLASLTFPIEVDSEVTPLTMAHEYGAKIYARSASFLLAKAIHDVLPEARFSISYSAGPGLYCQFKNPAAPGLARAEIAGDQVQRVGQRMRELVRRDLPIIRRKLSFTRAVQLFEEAGQTDRLNLLRYRNPPRIVVHICEQFHDLAQGPMVPSTGCLQFFELIPHPPGFVLQLPDRLTPRVVPPFQDQPHLFRIFEEHTEWGRILGVNTVGALNQIVAGGTVGELVFIAEALHEKKVARIADAIAARRPGVKLVLVSGPSSAGKTTFSKRLAIQMRVLGLKAFTIGLDDYFVDRARTPRDADGNYDFEHIDAVDQVLFNRHLQALIRGEEVALPTFNFETKAREFRGDKRHLEADQVIIVEGIHALNPQLTPAIPDAEKFRIYISAMTQLELDSHNRISTTDNRLIRRMVRDFKYRGHSAIDTIRMWPSVRRGEERWIFPYQSYADTFFNSALDYELAVLKPLAEPLLTQVKPIHPEYAEARRLTAFLMNFLGISDREVPSTSILREYVGRSGFRY